LKLYEITGNEKELDFVRSHYTDLKNSPDYTIFGSVMEFFGGKGLRDEGCASADFVRLALHLYQITEDPHFLYDAEKALFNALYFNQYPTGDFGHHILTKNKQTVYEGVNQSSATFTIDGVSSHYRMAAWWCCTMHGLRCMQDAREQIIKLKDGALYVDLFLETNLSIQDSDLAISRITHSDYPLYYEFEWSAYIPYELYMRFPEWATRMEIYKNGKLLKVERKGNYLHIPEKINKKDVLGVGFELPIQLIDLKGKKDSSISQYFSGYIYYGPFLMGIDDGSDPVFLSEPNDNELIVESIREVDAIGKAQNGKSFPYLVARYHHAGFPSELQTMLRPVNEYALENRPNASIKFEFESENEKSP
jgi:DUF1680 family protein